MVVQSVSVEQLCSIALVSTKDKPWGPAGMYDNRDCEPFLAVVSVKKSDLECFHLVSDF